MTTRKATAGRPSTLNPTTTARLVKALQMGAFMDTAAAFAGLSKDTLYRWLKLGDRDREEGKTTTLACIFSDAVAKAMADNEIGDLAVVGRAAMAGNWQAAAWRLERKNPARWGRQRVERVGATDAPPVQTQAVPTNFDRDQVRRMAEAVLAEIPGEANG